MFKLKASVGRILEPLTQVIGIVERRHTLPILSNVLIEQSGGRARFLATDLEVQITSSIEVTGDGSITVAAKKLYDILRALPADADCSLETKEGRMTVKAGKSRFALQTLGAADFPRIIEAKDAARTITLKQKAFKQVLSLTQFAMAVQDIRYYLNGVLLSIAQGTLRVVSTDGHRLSYATHALEQEVEPIEAILPRKTVIELSKLLSDSDDPLEITLASNQVRFHFSGIEIVSKIVEGKFPDYQKVIPTNQKNHAVIDRVPLQQALQRAAILSNEKIRGVRLMFAKDQLSIVCNNTEQEEAEETLAIEYGGDPVDIGFNIAYLQDVLNHIDTQTIRVGLGEATTSALIQMPEREDFKYVVMPMRI